MTRSLSRSLLTAAFFACGGSTESTTPAPAPSSSSSQRPPSAIDALLGTKCECENGANLCATESCSKVFECEGPGKNSNRPVDQVCTRPCGSRGAVAPYPECPSGFQCIIDSAGDTSRDYCLHPR